MREELEKLIAEAEACTTMEEFEKYQSEIRYLLFKQPRTILAAIAERDELKAEVERLKEYNRKLRSKGAPIHAATDMEKERLLQQRDRYKKALNVMTNKAAVLTEEVYDLAGQLDELRDNREPRP